MAIQQRVQLGPSIAASSANNIVTTITPTSGTALTLNGSTVSGGVATLDVPREVLLTYGNEASARTMVITGTNANGGIISQTLAVPSGASGTVATTESFKTVTSALPLGGGFTAAVTLGTNGVVPSPWQLLGTFIAPEEFVWNVVVTGTVNWTIQVTIDDLNNNKSVMGSKILGNAPIPPAILPTTGTGVFPPYGSGGSMADLIGATGNAAGYLSDVPISAWRIILNSGGTGAGDTVVATCLQAGLSPR